jgi:RNA polymerase sigma factor (sigma-70 family)
MLTVETIEAAKTNDLAAISTVVEETEGRIKALADKFARRMSAHSGSMFAHYREEFAQIGRVTVWESIARHQGASIDSFFAFMHHTVEGAMRHHARVDRCSGADVDAQKVFSTMLDEAEGDPFKAEKLAQTLPPKGRRLSADRAQAARMAWMGAVSIDAQSGDDDSSIAHTLAAHDEEPEVRPKVGHGAALEALSVLRRYTSVTIPLIAPRELSDNLPALVAVLEDAVTVPREAFARRAVLDAMAILRSAVSTATDGELAEDLRDATDKAHADSAAKRQRVHTVLQSMGAGQREILLHSFGIDGAADFGHGDSGDLKGLAAHLGITPRMVQDRRKHARRSFATRYIALAAESEAEAVAMAEAAQRMMAPGGRK